MVLGRLLGISGRKLKNHDAVISEEALARVMEVTPKIRVMIEPPDAVPRHGEVSCARALHARQFGDGGFIVGWRPPILSATFKERQDSAGTQVCFGSAPLIVVYQDERGCFGDKQAEVRGG